MTFKQLSHFSSENHDGLAHRKLGAIFVSFYDTDWTAAGGEQDR